MVVGERILAAAAAAVPNVSDLLVTKGRVDPGNSTDVEEEIIHNTQRYYVSNSEHRDEMDSIFQQRISIFAGTRRRANQIRIRFLAWPPFVALCKSPRRLFHPRRMEKPQKG